MSPTTLNPFAAFSLENKHIAVLGASSGLGAEIAVRCSELGAKVTLMARREDRLNEVRAKCASGQDHQVVTADVLDIKSLEAAFVSVRKGGGPLSGLVYATGVNVPRPLAALDEKNLDLVVDTNYKGAMLATRYALSKGGLEPGGSIVWISSISAYLAGGGGTAVYAASKAALEGAKRVLAVELAARKIRINCITAGAILTEIWDSINSTMGERFDEKVATRHLFGLGKPDDIANAAAYLLAPASKWVTGTSLVVDGGFMAHNRA